jgi:hypothetical protein
MAAPTLDLHELAMDPRNRRGAAGLLRFSGHPEAASSN